ncbi:uncharacterized protein LOC114523713 [Dendronephthya gigantea]|uniref:uncharacterized protein LOC114523713 n=1 Tax=Dendronephthya gigantea TaxID=151771 RepID=UPI001069E7F9|nr:uncharacterized protein LOC114523713 [Dendronephthya gigantea]
MASFPQNRFAGIKRDYTPETVEHTLAQRGAEKLWAYMTSGGSEYINVLGVLTGMQAVQMAKAGLKGIYLSGWQVAADANRAGQTFPDQSLYPADIAAKLVERINNAFQRADQVQHMEGGHQKLDYFLPIVADCEAGLGGPLNAFEIVKNMIKAGAAGIHLEDQLASEKKCGHMGGKVLVPTQQFIRLLNAARLAADVMGTTTVIVGRTDANSAGFVTSDIDPRDKPFLTGARTPEGFFRSRAGLDQAIARALAYAPYCDVLWCETSNPNIEEARRFAQAVHALFPGKPLAYNCSPEIAVFQKELGRLGYRFLFISPAGFQSQAALPL